MNCFYCGLEIKRGPKGNRTDVATKDHQTPRTRGGKDASANIVWSCAPCNEEKGMLTVDEYRAVLAFRAGLLWSAEKRFTFWGEKSLLNKAHSVYGVRAKIAWQQLPHKILHVRKKIATIGEIIFAKMRA